MTLRGTEPGSYITEYTLVYQDNSGFRFLKAVFIVDDGAFGRRAQDPGSFPQEKHLLLLESCSMHIMIIKLVHVV